MCDSCQDIDTCIKALLEKEQSRDDVTAAYVAVQTQPTDSSNNTITHAVAEHFAASNPQQALFPMRHGMFQTDRWKANFILRLLLPSRYSREIFVSTNCANPLTQITLRIFHIVLSSDNPNPIHTFAKQKTMVAASGVT